MGFVLCVFYFMYLFLASAERQPGDDGRYHTHQKDDAYPQVVFIELRHLYCPNLRLQKRKEDFGATQKRHSFMWLIFR